MKSIDYEYRLQAIGADGFANVEYITDKVGRLTVWMYLPSDNIEAMHQKIIENFPVTKFYAAWLSRFNCPGPNGHVTGKGTIDLDDWFVTTCNGNS